MCIFSIETFLIAHFSLAFAEIFSGEAQTDTQINSTAIRRLNEKLMLVMQQDGFKQEYCVCQRRVSHNDTILLFFFLLRRTFFAKTLML